MLTIYQAALVRFFSQIKWGGSIVPVVLAGPDRAHAQVKDWLHKNKGIILSQADGETATPYPFIAVWMARFQTETLLVNPRHYRIVNPQEGFGYAMRKPEAVKAAVDVNIYVEDLEQSNHLELQIRNLFINKHAWVTVDYDDPRWYEPPNDVFQFARILGQQKLRLVEEQLVDNTVLENSGLSGKEVRMTWSGEFFGWIPFQPYAVPVAETIEITLNDYNTGEEYSSVVVAAK